MFFQCFEVLTITYIILSLCYINSFMEEMGFGEKIKYSQKKNIYIIIILHH